MAQEGILLAFMLDLTAVELPSSNRLLIFLFIYVGFYATINTCYPKVSDTLHYAYQC